MAGFFVLYARIFCYYFVSQGHLFTISMNS